MLPLLLLLQVTAVDSVYSTPALRAFIARAAVQNRAPPLQLSGYRATVESEFGFILRDTLGREDVGQIEQIAARAEWDRGGRYELHVVGYRAQSLGAPYSALTFTRMYTVPTLYGNRLAVGMNDGMATTKADSARRRRFQRQDSLAGRAPFRAVHPLSVDREKYYRYSGGDIVAIITAGGRAVRVARVSVDPVENAAANFVGFKGELDFDADRHQLVRMRGRFVSYTTRKDPLFVRSTGAVAVAFIEFENAEVSGKYWLPTFQRSEFQAQMGILGDVRPIYRIVTRFRDFRLLENDTLTVAEGDTILPQLPPTRSKLTFAAKDSASHYGGWVENIGTKIGSVGPDDFEDLAPNVWRPTGKPSFSYWPRRLEDVARYNRVEGMFTGVTGTLRFRDLAPGLTARGTVGVAWEEQTVRGALSASLARGHWITGGRVERELAVTNDFLQPLESGLSIGPLFSSLDDADYVDRWTAALSTARIVKDVDRALITLEAAAVRDRPEFQRLVNGVFSTGATFRPNRNAAPGDYVRGRVAFEFHPRVTGDGLSPGVGARVQYETAFGDLEWQRVDARLTMRRYWHGLILATRADGGAAFGASVPPQVMYELGGGNDLPSYEYKEFGGDRAAVGRGLVAYYFPVLRTPRRLGPIVLPGISPGIGGGVHGGWSEASTAAARAALLALGGDGVTPLSRGTGRIRATADVRFTLFSGIIGAGFARPVDHQDRWRPFFVWGAGF